MEFLEWLLVKTEKFPKKSRFTFVNRINNLSLDLVEDIIEAKYSRIKVDILKRANLKLEKLRILLRISHSQKYLDNRGYEYSIKSIDESGKMLGGWIKQKENN